MVRHVRDPWAKKTRKGMKRLESMGKFAVGVTAYAAHKYKTTPNRPPAEDVHVSPIGYFILIVGFIGALFVYEYVDGLLGGLLAILCGFLSIVIGLVVGMLTYKDDSGLSENNMNDAPDSEEKEFDEISHEKIVSIKGLLFKMAPYEYYEKEIEGLSQSEKEKLLMAALNEYYAEMAESLEITKESEDYADTFIEKLSLPADKIQSYLNNDYVEYEKALNLFDILNGITPTRVTIDHPINMTKNEQPLWVFPRVDYYEEIFQRSFAGATSTLNIKIAKGVYYRTGAFKGRPIVTSSLKAISSGDLIITNKCIYLFSYQKSAKYPIKKILSFLPYEDGLGLQLDKANAKNVYFKGLDGRYAYNIVSNIKNLK